MDLTAGSLLSTGVASIDSITSIVNNETKDLYQTMQRARHLLNDVPSDLGLLDLIVVGEVASGKSSVLSALSGLKLPIGSEGITKTPISTTLSENIESDSIQLHWPTGGTKVLGPDGLDTATYEQAMQLLQAQDDNAPTFGAVKGLKIEAGVPIHPPITLVDTPALVLQPGDASKDPFNSMLDQILAPGGSGSTLFPIVVCQASANFSINQLDLVKDRPFVAVITHAELLREEHLLVRQVQTARQELEKKGCKGLFLVSLNGAEDQDPSWYRSLLHDDGSASAHLTGKERSELLKVCGVPQLRAALQKLQYEHMLADYSEVMGKLRARLQEVEPQLQKLQQPEVELQNEICQALLLVQKDVEESHRGRDQLGDFSEVQQLQRLHYEISQVLGAFSARAFHTALTNVNDRWASETASMVANNTLMIDWRTKIWNISARGMMEVLGGDVAEAALVDLKKILLGFVQWRARERLSFMGSSAHSHTIFMDFLERYTSEKLRVLQKECEMIREEVHINELDTHAPFAFWLFVQQAMQHKEDSEVMVVNILQHALGVQNADIGERQGAFWPMDLPWFQELFSKDLHQHQLMSIVLLFFTVGEIVERLSKRMVCIMFGRTYFPRNVTPASPNITLADLTLEQAFRSYTADNQLKMKDMVDQSVSSQLQLKAALEDSMAQLHTFSAAAWNAVSLAPISSSTAAAAASFQSSLRSVQLATGMSPILVQKTPTTSPQRPGSTSPERTRQQGGKSNVTSPSQRPTIDIPPAYPTSYTRTTPTKPGSSNAPSPEALLEGEVEHTHHDSTWPEGDAETPLGLPDYSRASFTESNVAKGKKRGSLSNARDAIFGRSKQGGDKDRDMHRGDKDRVDRDRIPF